MRNKYNRKSSLNEFLSEFLKWCIAGFFVAFLLSPSFRVFVLNGANSFINKTGERASILKTNSKSSEVIPKIALAKGSETFDKKTNKWLSLTTLPSFGANSQKAKWNLDDKLKPILVLHHTAIPSQMVVETQKIIQGKGSSPTSVHFGVQADGKIDQFLKLNSGGYHVLNSDNYPNDSARVNVFGGKFLKGGVNLNKLSYGIEIYYCPRQGSDNIVEEISQAQIQSLAKLIVVLEKIKGITPERIFFHSEVQPTEYGERWQEPQYLVFDKTDSKEEIKIHPNWYKLITQVRAFGGYKAGKWSQMSNIQLADSILIRNFENAKTFLESLQSPTKLDLERFQGYKNILKGLKDK